MTALVVSNSKLPAHIAKLAGIANAGSALNEMTGGVTAGFPILSYKGKVWRIRKGGEEQMHVDANDDPLPSIEVVLVQANPNPSKIYYAKGYVEGDNSSPDCFSNDGLRPDASVKEPVNPICANCPKNAWGSKINESGKKGRACGDARRMAVVFAQDLYEKGADAEKFLLRVPAASLNPLKEYAEKTLAPKGLPFFALATRISFDPQVAHPQFRFQASRFLNEEEAEAVLQLRDSDDVRRILAEAQEFPAGGAAKEEAATTDAAPAPTATTPPAGAAPAKAKPATPRPATEEEAGLDALAPPPPPRRAAQPAAPAAPAPAAEPEPAPAPKKRKAAAAPAPAPAPVVASDEDEEEQAEAPAAPAPENFDSLLDSILGS